MKSTRFAVNVLPTPLAHDVRRFRWRISNPAEFAQLQRYRLEKGAAGLGSFDQHGTIFVHIPKCAGTSISSTLFGTSVGAHHSISYYQIIYPWLTFRRYFKFSFVRNPYDRLVSAFLYMQKGGGNASDAEWSRIHADDLVDFKTFVARALVRPKVFGAMHFQPQINYLQDFRSSFPIEFVGRYERLEEDFERVAKKLNVNRKLQWINRTDTRKIVPYQEFYDDQTRGIVANLYSEDLRLLGYDFE